VSNEVFDYIVVGGGSGGSVVASRLAAAGSHVLLLEAGRSDKRLDVRIPASVASAYQRVNWKYPAEPGPSRTSQPEAWMAGKVMGGGGSINSCVFVRGNRADYDGWAKEGCTGWDYASVLPSFRRLETWESGPDGYRGGDGPISVCVQSASRGQANLAYIEACVQTGYARTRITTARARTAWASRRSTSGALPGRRLAVSTCAGWRPGTGSRSGRGPRPPGDP
jgi:choline dehydrogenase